ncbi:MAG: hypothetical protein U0V56_03810 [Actinomycetota bacterium]
MQAVPTSVDPPSTGSRLRAGIGVLLPLAGVACGITLLFLGMRSVMEIGGACASGGPYVPRRPCPDGVPALMIGGIWGGVICAFVYVWQTIKHRVPSLAVLFWPALFLSLGWNFLEFGLHPPGGDGLAWGWLVCAAVFLLMGGVPLPFAIAWLRRSFGQPDEPVGGVRSQLAPPVSAFSRSAWGSRARSGTAEPGPPRAEHPEEMGSDLVADLERLDALHRSGALDDEQYEAAKDRMLGTGDA